MSNRLGTIVSRDDLSRMGLTVADTVRAVWGEDWSGNPVPRAVRKGYSTVLRGELGEYDTQGPKAILCGECAEVVLSTAERTVSHELQIHLSVVHGISAAALP